jgi:preprotein translocase subunit SecB
MTDAKSSNGTPPPPAASLPPLLINAQFVKDLSFENPRAPEIFAKPQQGQPQVQVGVDVGARALNETVFEVSLHLKAEAKNAEDTVFMVELTYCGVFTVSVADKEDMRPLLLIEAPRLLFPFARTIVAECTREGGFPPLLIQPIDFADLFRRQGAQQAPATANA